MATSPHRGRSTRSIIGAAADPLSTASAGLFAGLSFLRRKRVFHPNGQTYSGHVRFQATSFDLPFVGRHDVVVRLSRGAGLPEPLPDLYGIALTIPGLGQDLLFATSGGGVAGRHALLPTTGFFRLPFSTILPYDHEGTLVVFGARATDDLRGVGQQQMKDLGSYAAAGRLRFDLTVSRAGSGSSERFGHLAIDSGFDGDVKFNPWNTHPRLRPAGRLNRMRRESYATSQAARPDA